MLYIATKASVLQYDFSVLMCFQALCLHIIRSDPQVRWEYFVFFLFRNFVFPRKLSEHFVFLSIKPQLFVVILPCLQELVCFFWSEQVFQMLC